MGSGVGAGEGSGVDVGSGVGVGLQVTEEHVTRAVMLSVMFRVIMLSFITPPFTVQSTNSQHSSAIASRVTCSSFS